MSARRATVVLLSAVLVGAALGSPAEASGPEAGSGSGRLEGRHSLRAPVTDENFYFVMADRFDNGDDSNNTGGIPGDRLAHG